VEEEEGAEVEILKEAIVEAVVEAEEEEVELDQEDAAKMKKVHGFLLLSWDVSSERS